LQSLNGALHVVPGKMVCAEVRIFRAIAKHVPRCGEHRRSDAMIAFFEPRRALMRLNWANR